MKIDKIRAGLNPVKTAKQPPPPKPDTSGPTIERMMQQQRERMLSGLEQQRTVDAQTEAERQAAEQRQREADAAKQRRDDEAYRKWLSE